jgi:integrase
MPGKVDLWKHPGSGRYYITWTERGRSLRASTRSKDRKQAERVRAAFVLERDRQPQAKPDEIAVTTLLDSYYERHAKGLPSGERANIAINHLSEYYGAATVSAVGARAHERYIEQCRKEGKADGTINRHLGALRAALRFAVKSGDLGQAPHVPSLREPPPRPHVLDRDDVAALLRAARRLGHDHVATFIRLAVFTGARRNAILQLTWDRVDLKAGTVDFRLPGIMHARKRRAITGLPYHLLSSLRRLQKRSRTPTVISYRGKPVASIRRAFRETAKAAKLPHVTPHVLKHTAVSWALRVASPWVVSGMTATSVRTLQAVYGKHMIEDLKVAAEAMAQSRTITRNRRAKRPISRETAKRGNGKKKPRK